MSTPGEITVYWLARPMSAASSSSLTCAPTATMLVVRDASTRSVVTTPRVTIGEK